jgi:hypothetical protein
MQSSSAPEADVVTPFDRWRQWAMSLRKTSRDNLLTCRADKRAMRHMSIREEDTLSSSFGEIAEADSERPSLVREQPFQGQTSPPALRRQSHRGWSRPTQASLPHSHEPPSRPASSAPRAYPNVDLASVAETEMDVVVKAILGPVPNTSVTTHADVRMTEVSRQKLEKALRLLDAGAAGSIHSTTGGPGSREQGATDVVTVDSNGSVDTMPRYAPLHPAAEATTPTSELADGADKGGRRAVPPPPQLRQLEGNKVSVVPRSEVVDAYHKGQAVEVVCPCCATSLITLVNPSLRMMIYCPVCESIAPCALCVES